MCRLFVFIQLFPVGTFEDEDKLPLETIISLKDYLKYISMDMAESG